jgi:NAD(P)-dependent dehydrogenase (short-subunit alcohol dehydrogenase family)
LLTGRTERPHVAATIAAAQEVGPLHVIIGAPVSAARVSGREGVVLPEEGEGSCGSDILSPSAFTYSPQASLYAMGKNGLVTAARAMAASCAADGIRVNALAPGATDTDMVRNNEAAAVEARESAGLLGRLGRPEEMAPPA